MKTVLIPTNDHGYRVAVIRKMLVVYSAKYDYWGEYTGEENLMHDEVVLEMEVAE